MAEQNKLYRVKKIIRQEFVLRAKSKEDAEKIVEEEKPKPCGELIDVKTQVIR